MANSLGLDIYWANQASVSPKEAGGTRHFDMGRELVQSGANVTLIASDLSLATRRYGRRRRSSDLRPIHECVDGVEFVWLSAGAYRMNDWRRVVSMVTFGAGTALYLLGVRSNERTVFIGSSPHLFTAMGAWIAASIRDIPFVLEVRDLWPESYVDLLDADGARGARVLRWMADWLYHRASAIVVLTEPNRSVIAGRGVDPSKIYYVPNGVDLSSFDFPNAVQRRGAHVTFVYTGAHGPANGLDILIRACSQLHDDGEDVIEVILVGDGPSKDGLMDLARQLDLTNVHFREPVPKSEIAPLLASADVGLMVLAPAKLFASGVSPNKLFDYLAADLPVLGNVPGVVADIIEVAGAGRSCIPGDSEALARAMLEIATEIRADRRRYRVGRDFVATQYNRRDLAERLSDVLTIVTETGHAGEGLKTRKVRGRLKRRARVQ